MSPLISIIIPVYNVEQYLDYCLQSVLSQDYTNLEIILVDDGSTDTSGKMCDEYSAKDSRVKVFHHRNSGISHARNFGMKEMSGEYFSFIDSDDYIRKDYISSLYRFINEYKADMSVCEVEKVIGNKDFNLLDDKKTDSTLLDREEAKLQMIARNIPMYVPGKLYKRYLAEHMEFPEGKRYEDVPASWNAIKNVNKAVLIKSGLYYYRQRVDSFVNMRFTKERMSQVYFSEDIFNEIDGDNDMKYAAGSRCFFAAADDYSLITNDFQEEKKYLKKALKKYRRFVIKDRNAKKNLKVMAFMSLFGTPIVRVLGRAYKKRNLQKWQKEQAKFSTE